MHAVLEATDFAAADLDAELAAQVAAELARRPVDVGGRGRSSPGCGRRSRRRSARSSAGCGCATSRARDRLDELGFELPLAGGDDPVGRVTPGAIGAVLREHLAPDDPLAATPSGSRIPSCARACAAT